MAVKKKTVGRSLDLAGNAGRNHDQVLGVGTGRRMAQPEADRRPLRLRAMPPGRLRRKRQNPYPTGRHNDRVAAADVCAPIPQARELLGSWISRAWWVCGIGPLWAPSPTPALALVLSPGCGSKTSKRRVLNASWGYSSIGQKLHVKGGAKLGHWGRVKVDHLGERTRF